MSRFNGFLWSTSIALSWLWGLGLFFSVQMSILFGLWGLLGFVIPNSLGLILFGFYTQRIARREGNAEKFSAHFVSQSKKFRGIFLFYQVVAVALCVFALLKYAILPVQVSLIVVAILFLGIALWVGDEANIAGIKYIHGIYFAVIMILLGAIYFFRMMPESEAFRDPAFAEGLQPVGSLYFASYLIPIIIGLIAGPWLDIQQWQRAIQIHREGGSVYKCYIGGGIIFFGLIVLHGLMALWVKARMGFSFSVPAFGELADGKAVITNYFVNNSEGIMAFGLWCYLGFVALAIISTLDSAYLATKWYLSENIKTSQNILLNFIPKSIFTSPIPLALIAGIAGVTTAIAPGILPDIPPFSLEYFMVLYATFFVGFAVVFFADSYANCHYSKSPLMPLFSVGLIAIAIFALGYFSGQRHAWLMIVGSALPLVVALILVAKNRLIPLDEMKDKLVELKESVSKEVATLATQTLTPSAPVNSEAPTPVGTPGSSTFFDGKWFCYTFTTTYSDTNSVGNVYFAYYGIWVGKTRELFFAHAMPDFDIKTTEFYILTREFKHKFIRETKEFMRVYVKIRVASFNRKFVTMEHQIVDAEGNTIGKGEQVLMFVSSKDYKLLDIPPSVYSSFIGYT